MLKKLLTGLIVSAALLTCLPALIQATTVERLSLDDLAARSQTIVQGTVLGSRTYWSPDGKLILTNTTIQVTESLKGQAGRTVEVTTVGGQIGDRILHVGGMPAFVPGESTIVFAAKITKGWLRRACSPLASCSATRTLDTGPLRRARSVMTPA